MEERSFLKMKKEYMKQANSLFEKAYRDELTGLLNRYGLKEALRQLDNEQEHAVIALDIDQLKAVNDTYGHPIGDEVIASVAELLRKNTRAGDILARIGGDEFVLVLQKMNQPEVTLQKMQKICKDIAQTATDHNQTHTSCSVGIAFMKDTATYEEVYAHADEAMYEAKSSGRNTCILWSKEE